MGFWTNRNVFVTGATGLLGSWLVEELIAQGAQVVCLIRDWVPGSRLIASGLVDSSSVIHGALEDLDTVRRAIHEQNIDTVFHLGAQTIVGAASRSALATFEANVRGTWNVLEACRLADVQVERIVVASSDKAYGAHPDLPYREAMPLRGLYPYDVSKSCADMLSQSYHQTYGLPVAITRCVNLFGGGDLNFSRLIPGTILAALQDVPPVIRSDGRFVRDYLYVRDAVYANLRLAEKMTSRRDLWGEAFNFGAGEPQSVLETVRLILDVMKASELTPDVLNEASNEIRSQYLDCSKATEMLGWEPRYSREQGLRETVEWYRSYASETGLT